MYSPHYTPSINCRKKNIQLQRQQNYGVWNDGHQNTSSTAYLIMYKLIA